MSRIINRKLNGALLRARHAKFLSAIGGDLLPQSPFSFLSPPPSPYPPRFDVNATNWFQVAREIRTWVYCTWKCFVLMRRRVPHGTQLRAPPLAPASLRRKIFPTQRSKFSHWMRHLTSWVCAHSERAVHFKITPSPHTDRLRNAALWV